MSKEESPKHCNKEFEENNMKFKIHCCDKNNCNSSSLLKSNIYIIFIILATICLK